MIDDEKVERVARAPCKLDGINPDGERLTGRRAYERTANSPREYDETEPECKARVSGARRFVAAFDALSGG